MLRTPKAALPRLVHWGIISLPTREAPYTPENLDAPRLETGLNRSEESLLQNQPYQYGASSGPPSPPNILFDGTRLGLEATMLVGLCVAIPGGVQTALSVTLGYFTRYARGLPASPHPFALGTFVFAWLASVIILSMIMFFGSSIPTMFYTMLTVRFALFWLRKRKKNDKRASAIAGGVLAFLFAFPCTALSLLITDLSPTPQALSELLRWPAILSIDAIVLLWTALFPLLSIIGGVRSGLKIGEIAENVKLYWYF